jgi:hypothetical protein
METSQIRKLLHDLNNALNAAKIHAYLLRQDFKDPKHVDTLNGLEEAIEGARKLIADAYEKVPPETRNA